MSNLSVLSSSIAGSRLVTSAADFCRVKGLARVCSCGRTWPGVPACLLLLASSPVPRPSNRTRCVPTSPASARGLTAVIAAATQNLKLPQEQITLTYCDLNGERFRNEEFVFTLLRTQSAFRDPNDYVSPADCWGDVGAASGPLFVVLAVAAKLRGHAKGSHPLLWAASDSGYRSALALALEV